MSPPGSPTPERRDELRRGGHRHDGQWRQMPLAPEDERDRDQDQHRDKRVEAEDDSSVAMNCRARRTLEGELRMRGHLWCQRRQRLGGAAG